MLYYFQQNPILEIKVRINLKPYFQALSLFYAKRKQRKQLLQLDADLLNDIGKTREQAIEEAKA